MTEAPPSPRRIALAGASGTIGAAVLRRLQGDGHHVAVLPRATLADDRKLAQALAERG
jgi:divinyl chlorophyllide a 8-vinyl-reductase